MTQDKEQRPPLIERLRKATGDKVRTTREQLGWTQAQLAEKADTNQQTVDRIERGVTTASKALPKIMSALGIEGNYGLNDDIRGTVDRMLAASRSDPVEGPPKLSDAIRRWRDTHVDKIPLYGRSKDDGLVLILSIDPIYPVDQVQGAYGLMVSNDEMNPAVRRGDFVIVNPLLPPLMNAEVVVISHQENGESIDIFTLADEDEDQWSFTTWKPIKTFKMPKEETTVHMVVAKIARYR